MTPYISQYEDIGTWNNFNGKIWLFTAKIVKYLKWYFGLLHKPWDYFVLSIKVTPNRGVTLIDLLCEITSKGHFYPKNNFEEVMKKKDVLYRNAGIL